MNRIIGNINNDNLLFEIDDKYLEKCFTNKENLNYKKRKYLVEYLYKAKMLFGLLDETKCIFSNKMINHYETWFTDGEWVWSVDLVHYTEHFYFQWPKEFVQSIESKKFKMLKVSEKKLSVIAFNPKVIEYAKKYRCF